MCVLALWQVLDGGDEFESLWEELGGSGKHQLVGLSDRHVGHAGDVGDLLLTLLVLGRLRRHVDGGGRHRDGGAAGDDVEVLRLLGDVGGRPLHVAGQVERAAEPVHEVPGRDDLDVGVVELQDELEAAADLLLADSGHLGRGCRGDWRAEVGNSFASLTR